MTADPFPRVTRGPSRRATREGDERGYVLIVVLVLLMATTAAGHSLLVLARAELSVSVAHWAGLVRRLAAEGGVRLASGGIARIGSLPLKAWTPAGEGIIPPGARFASTALRLSSEVVLLRSEARVDRFAGTHVVLGVYWGMHAEARVGAASGIVVSGGPMILGGGSRIETSRVGEAPPPWSEARCAEYRPGLDTLFGGGVPAWADLRKEGAAFGFLEDRAMEGGPLVLPSLGLLDHEALLEGAQVSAPSPASPAPSRVGPRCDQTSPLNWGAPMDPLDPCAEYRPVVVSEGPLTMRGGVGQGVLLVVGDAILSSGAQYFGVVVVAGDLSVRSGARISGLVRVGGTVSLDGGSEVVGSSCAALAALESAVSLQGLIPLPEGFWLDDPY